MSLDDYITDKNQKVDWLNGHEQNKETIDTYSPFKKY